MPRGTIFDSERVFLIDPRSGLTVLRLTHAASITQNLYFEMCSFTQDERYVMVSGQRYGGRAAPWDLLRVRTDGLEIVQLTEYDDLSGLVFSSCDNLFYYQTQGELRKLDVLSLQEEVVAKVPIDKPGFWPVVRRTYGAIDDRGEQYFGVCANRPDQVHLFKVELKTGRAEVLHVTNLISHVHVDPAGKTLFFIDGAIGPAVMDVDGRNLRPYPFRQLAHHTWFGDTGMMQGTLVPPGNALVTYREGDAEPTILAHGRYYWHSGCSRDAQWIVSDTNWPQEGLYLLHVPTQTATYVCDPRSSCSHPQWTHPHPALSPGMKYVLFNSDMTGIGQVYMAILTEEFLQQASKGYLCKPGLLC